MSPIIPNPHLDGLARSARHVFRGDHNIALAGPQAPRLRLPLAKCVLRCDKGMVLIRGGLFGETRFNDVQKNIRKFHGGVDLYAEPGADCYAIYDGDVQWARDEDKGDWGKAVLLRYEFPGAPTRWALYAHLSEVRVSLKEKAVKQGRIVGTTGTTGNASKLYPHLHFEVWQSLKAWEGGKRYRIDPLEILGSLPFQPLANELIESYQRA
jgi:murein DD-endopeptidase MepM/ murein hydrolase activator NlpD